MSLRGIRIKEGVVGEDAKSKSVSDSQTTPRRHPQGHRVSPPCPDPNPVPSSSTHPSPGAAGSARGGEAPGPGRPISKGPPVDPLVRCQDESFRPALNV